MLAFLAYLSADMHLNGVCISLRMHLTRRASPIGHFIGVALIGVALIAVSHSHASHSRVPHRRAS